jgi:opacity protein-like surface antigen
MILKKLLLTTALILMASYAMAENSWYVSVDLGVQVPTGEASHVGTNSADTPSYDFENSAVAGLAAGYFINDALRVEAELRIRTQEPEDGNINGRNSRSGETFNLGGDVDTTTIMANIIYDFDNTSKFTPYVKGGVGIAHSEISANLDIQPTFTNYGIDRWQFPDNDETNFAWALGIGCDYSLTEKILFGLEYQYIDMGDVSTGVDMNADSVDYELNSHEITFGITYLF